MIGALIIAGFILVISPLVLAFLFVRPVCGAYDPPDYRCGKCDHCKRGLWE